VPARRHPRRHCPQGAAPPLGPHRAPPARREREESIAAHAALPRGPRRRRGGGGRQCRAGHAFWGCRAEHGGVGTVPPGGHAHVAMDCRRHRAGRESGTVAAACALRSPGAAPRPRAYADAQRSAPCSVAFLCVFADQNAAKRGADPCARVWLAQAIPIVNIFCGDHDKSRPRRRAAMPGGAQAIVIACPGGVG